MKVTLVNPRSKAPHEIQQKCFAPIGLLYLASSLMEHGHEVKVIDANALGLEDDEIAREVQNSRPDLVGVPLLSDIFFPTFLMVERIKLAYPACKILLGGPHASALPEEVLREFIGADYLLKDECEESIVELCAALEGKVPISSVRGLYYRADGKIARTGPSEPVKDLDALQFPARRLVSDLYKKNKYYMVLVRERPVETMITSRGCPFRCRFCSNTSSSYRMRSPENVLGEIKALHENGVRNIDVGDANFTFDRPRAIRIFELIKNEGIRMSFRIKSRADSIDEEMVRKAKEAGVYLISIGMESGSQDMLDRMSKGSTLEDNISACETVMRAGVKLNTGWIIGFPGETLESINETVRLISKIKPTTANINLLVPYPGTEVYLEAKQEGRLAGDWTVKDGRTPWVKLPWAGSFEDMQDIVRQAKKRVYFRPHYIINFVGEIIGGANLTLARYALQEARKSLTIQPPEESRQSSEVGGV